MNKKNLSLFISFFKIGLFTFGGGYAMITLLENEIVNKKKFINKKDFLDLVAISESTPGPISINMATYIGYKVNKFLGAFFSTLAVILPSFIIMFIISLFFESFLNIKLVSYAFDGIRVCVIYLMLLAAFKLVKNLTYNMFNKIIISLVSIVFCLLSLISKNISSIIYIIICGLVGIVLFAILGKEGDNK